MDRNFASGEQPANVIYIRNTHSSERNHFAPNSNDHVWIALASITTLSRIDRRPSVYVVLFLKELWHLILHSFDFSEQQIMLVVLGLIDVVMISNLLLMVIVGGYETFVSRMNLAGHPDEPEWLSHVNAGVLKIKLAMAIIGISSIHLLRTFIEAGNLGGAGRTTDYTEAGVKWQTIIHVVFICSAVGIAYVDRISNGLIAAASKRTDAHDS
jgi:uncharacterized protein (TIGR00645 family)